MEDGRLDELRLLHRGLQRAALAEFVDLPSTEAPGATPLPLTELEAGWQTRWPAIADDADQVHRAMTDILGAPRPRAAPPSPRPGAPAGQLRVYVFDAPGGLRMMLDGGGVMRDVQLAWSVEDAERELGDALLELTRNARQHPASPALHRLYQRIGRPIDTAAQAASASLIVLHLDGHLRELPFAALFDGRGYLGERFAFTLAGPTPSTRAVTPAAPSHLHALGVTRALDGLPALPFVADEVCAIVAGPVHGLATTPSGCRPATGALSGEAWLDGAFTAEQLVEVLASGRRNGQAYLHLGTHFDLRAGRMSTSSLLLGDGQRLPLGEMAAWRFDGHALVTLAACDTGTHGAAAAESLQFLILRQGAGAVLASLWAVEDRSTSTLIQAFYRALPQLGPARALQRAQEVVRRTPGWAAPRYWAGFTLAEAA